MENILVLLVIGTIVFLAIHKVVRDRKNGVKCSGCPQSKICSTADSRYKSKEIRGSDIRLIKKA